MDLPMTHPESTTDSSGICCPRTFLAMSGWRVGQAVWKSTPPREAPNQGDKIGRQTPSVSPLGGSSEYVQQRITRSSADLSPGAQGGHHSLTRPLLPFLPSSFTSQFRTTLADIISN